MATKAEEPLATAADPSPSASPLLRRASPSPDDDREEEKESRDTKRRRTWVAALERLETEKENNSLDSFSFDARSVAPFETTPKFGSFTPVLLMETTIVESAEAPPLEKVSDEAPAKGESGPDREPEGEEEEEGDDTSKGKIGNSECSERE